MRRSASGVLGVLALAACGGQVSWNGVTPSGAGGGSGGVIEAVSVTAPTFSGLPCDVKGVLQNRCTGCHGTPLAQSAPYPLTTRAELVARDPLRADGGTVADRCLVRMTDVASPMPPSPGGLATAAELNTLRTWVNAGMPAGTCATPTVGCTSGSTWNGRENSNMEPGGTCISCHARHGGGEAPIYPFMGTVFGGYHEALDCNAGSTSKPLPSGLKVDILDPGTGEVVGTLDVLSPSGNFMGSAPGLSGSVYRAQVRSPSGAVRQMMNPVGSGDCNSCHTDQGTAGAPGRIVWPN